MKRKQIILLLILCAVLALLGGCETSKAELVEESPTEFTVRFVDGGEVLLTRACGIGVTMGSAPESNTLWRDGNGAFIDPETAIATDNTCLYAWRMPSLKEGYDTFLEAEDGSFAPDRALTRRDLAVIARKLMVENMEGVSAAAAFSDVPESDPAYEAIRDVCEQGLMSVYPDGTFRPDERITKEDYVAVLYLLAGMPDREERGGHGVTEEMWTADAVAYARENGWFADSTYRPEDSVTRAEAAFMTRCLRGGEIPAEDIVTLCPESPYADVPADDPAYAAILEASYRDEILDYLFGTEEAAAPGMQVIGGQLCHVDAETLRLDRYEPGFCIVDGGLYHMGDNGYFFDRMTAGLHELDGSMFYVPEDDGPFMTNDDYGYLHFGSNGRYTSGSRVVDECVEELLGDTLTDESLTKREKLYRGYCAIRDGGFYYRSRNAGWDRGTTAWALGCAKVMYTEKYGICYYWAAAFLYVARRVGYQAYPVCGGVGTNNQIHAWVVVIDDDGEEYICDVELEWAYRRGFYNVTYATADMFMQPLYATHAVYVFPGEQDEAFYTTYGVSRYESNESYIYVPPEAQIPPEETEMPEESAAPDESPQPSDGQTTEVDPAATNTPGAADPAAPTAVPEDTPASAVTPEPVVTPEPAPAEPEPVVEPDPVPVEPEPAPAADSVPAPAEDGTGDE